MFEKVKDKPFYGDAIITIIGSFESHNSLDKGKETQNKVKRLLTQFHNSEQKQNKREESL